MERILRNELFRRGFSLLMAGDYFEAHEVWEDLWRGMDREDPMRDFVRGMIMLSAAYYKLLRQGNREGALGLFRKAFQRLDGYGPVEGEVGAVIRFARGFSRNLAEIEE